MFHTESENEDSDKGAVWKDITPSTVQTGIAEEWEDRYETALLLSSQVSYLQVNTAIRAAFAAVTVRR